MKRGLAAVGVLAILCWLAGPSFAEWDKPCDHKQVFKKFYCAACKEIREFAECPTQQYMWDFEKHKGEKNPHMNLPAGWGCQRIQYFCVNDKCSKFKKCVPYPGSCDECGDDFQSNKVWSTIEFKCPKCGTSQSEPGVGFKLIEGRYEEQIEEAGKCAKCGTDLEVVCLKSGTCPHVSR